MPATELPDLRALEPALLVLLVLGVWALVVELRRGEPPAARPSAVGPWQRSDWWLFALGLWLLWRAAWAELAGVELGALSAWDLAVYYHAGPALLAGVDPYDAAALARHSGQTDLLSCYYPPLAVAMYAPLARLELETAMVVVFMAKLALVAALIGVWTRHLGPWVLFASAALWTYAIQIDLNNGNVSIVEQALLWAGVGALVRGRRLAFAALVVCAAMFKLQLISMAALALVVDPRHGWRPLVVALGGLAGYLLLNLALFPGPSQTWYLAAQSAVSSEGGFHAPSLASALHHYGAGTAALPVVTALVLGSSAWLLWRTRAAPRLELHRLMFAIVALTLSWPRLKDYGFIVMIPPTACVLAWLWAQPGRWQPKLGIAGLLAAVVLLTRAEPGLPFEDYRPLWLVAIVWLAAATTLLDRRARVLGADDQDHGVAANGARDQQADRDPDHRHSRARDQAGADLG